VSRKDRIFEDLLLSTTSARHQQRSVEFCWCRHAIDQWRSQSGVWGVQTPSIV